MLTSSRRGGSRTQHHQHHQHRQHHQHHQHHQHDQHEGPMTHVPLIETLVAYFVGPERNSLATIEIRGGGRFAVEAAGEDAE